MNNQSEPTLRKGKKKIRERSFLPGRMQAGIASPEPQSKSSATVTRLRKRAKHMITWGG